MDGFQSNSPQAVMVAGSAPIPVTMTASLVKVIPNSTLEAIEKLKADQQREEEARLAQVNTQLSAYVDKCFESAKRAKLTVERTILDSKKQVKGEYTSDKLAEIQKYGGSTTFIQHTGNKCTAAQSWIQDIVLPPDEYPASIEPTPIPDLPEADVQAIVAKVTMQFQQEMALSGGQIPDPGAVAEAALSMREKQLEFLRADAAKRARGMQQKIYDQLAESGFTDALVDVISNLIQTPAGILKGPVVRNRKMLAWEADPETGKQKPVVSRKMTFELTSVDPLDFYPSPHSRNMNDGYVIERVRTTRKDLRAMLGVEGYNDTEIQAVLARYGRSGLVTQQLPDAERATLENRDTVVSPGVDTEDPTLEGLEFWGSVPGSMLKDWGMGISDEETEEEFDIRAEMYDKHVICAVLNPDPLGRKPYYVSNFSEETGSLWGKGLPEIIKDIQDILNGCVRHLQNNLAISSGPQVAIDFNKLRQGFDWQNMHPWKVWPFEAVNGAPPATFFQPPSNAAELLAVFDKFDMISDDLTVPKYSYGNQQVVGAAATASGLSMLMNAANKRIKKVIAGIDRNIIRPMLARMYVYNMLYDEDESIKGDVQIVPRGAMALVVKEQVQMRRQEFLNSTANPIDMQIIGIKGRAKLLREVARSLALPGEGIVPTEDEIEAEIKKAQAEAALAAAVNAGQVQPGASPEQAPSAPEAPVAGVSPATAS